jgi:hypothetical protein
MKGLYIEQATEIGDKIGAGSYQPWFPDRHFVTDTHWFLLEA